MKAIRYRITLQEPAIFTMLAGEPNSSISYDFIPGSVLRGMIIGLWMRKEGKGYELDAGKADIRRRFFSADTRYLNAYPVIRDERGLPVPSTWKSFKYKEAGETLPIYDTACVSLPESRKKKNLSDFVHIEGTNAVIRKVDRVINVHTQRVRKSAGEQLVYRYDALAAGQTFEGIIICEHDDDAAELVALLKANKKITFGGARSAGYGLAKIDDVDFDASPHEYHGLPNQLGNEVLLTFLSDTLLRDENGLYCPTPAVIKAALQAHGIKCEVKPQDSEKEKEKRRDNQSIQPTWVGGFNRKWGLPLPQALAVERGSVIRLFNLDTSNETRAAIVRLLHTGLGERLEDGFGRVAIGWQQQSQYERVKQSPQQKPQKPDLTGDAQIMWDRLKERLAEEQVETRVSGIVYTDDFDIRGSISRTQLARLRAIIADELQNKEPTRGVLAAHVVKLGGKAAARQLEESRIYNRSLKDWLKNPVFGLPEKIEKDETYVLQLVDAVLERAQKKAKE